MEKSHCFEKFVADMPLNTKYSPSEILTKIEHASFLRSQKKIDSIGRPRFLLDGMVFAGTEKGFFMELNWCYEDARHYIFEGRGSKAIPTIREFMIYVKKSTCFCIPLE
jgi:hypothetical protein